jgi:hypothetical protein
MLHQLLFAFFVKRPEGRLTAVFLAHHYLLDRCSLPEAQVRLVFPLLNALVGQLVNRPLAAETLVVLLSVLLLPTVHGLHLSQHLVAKADSTPCVL